MCNTIQKIWEEVEWNWFQQDGQQKLYWHWSPDYNWDMNMPISGWNEGLIVYVLAASSPTYPISKSVYDNGWAQNGAIQNGNSYYNITLPLGADRITSYNVCYTKLLRTTSGLTFYQDGVSQGTKTWGTHGAINLVDSKIAGFRIGCGPQGDQTDVSDNWEASTWKGGLDQFRMYNTVLTADEVNTLFVNKQ